MATYSMGLSGFSNGNTSGMYDEETGETSIPFADILRYAQAVPEAYRASLRLVHHADNTFGTGMCLDFDGPDVGPARYGDFPDTIRAFDREGS